MAKTVFFLHAVPTLSPLSFLRFCGSQFCRRREARGTVQPEPPLVPASPTRSYSTFVHSKPARYQPDRCRASGPSVRRSQPKGGVPVSIGLAWCQGPSLDEPGNHLDLTCQKQLPKHSDCRGEIAVICSEGESVEKRRPPIEMPCVCETKMQPIDGHSTAC